MDRRAWCEMEMTLSVENEDERKTKRGEKEYGWKKRKEEGRQR